MAEEDRICHPKIFHFGMRIISELKAIEKKQTGETLCPPTICLKGGHKFTKCPSSSPLPGKTTSDAHQPGDGTKGIHIATFTNQPLVSHIFLASHNLLSLEIQIPIPLSYRFSKNVLVFLLRNYIRPSSHQI